jgi:GTP-binding protein
MSSDMALMERLALNGVPFARVFTKTDKVGPRVAERIRLLHDKTMLENWESLPPTFVTSATKGTGRDELLDYIKETMIFYERKK